MPWNLGTLTSWNPLNLSKPEMELLYLFRFTLTLCSTSHFSHDRSNWSSPSLYSTTFQNSPGISDLLSAVSKFQHLIKLCSMCSNLPVSSLNLSPFCWWKQPSSSWTLICPDNRGFNFTCTSCVICYHATQKYLKCSTFCRSFLSIMICTVDGCLKILITIIACTFIYIPYHLPTSISLSITSCSTVSSLASSTSCTCPPILKPFKTFKSFLRKVFAV